MKYSILGFNQQKVLELDNELDLTDLLILNYIWMAQAQPSMKHIIHDGQPYVWLKLNKFMEDLPILNIRKRALQSRIKRLEDIDLIKTEQSNSEQCRGSKVYFTITSKCEELLYEEGPDVTQYTRSEGPGVANYTRSREPDVTHYTRSRRPGVANYTSDKRLEIDKKLEIDKEIPQKLFNTSSNSKPESGPQMVVDMYNQICHELPSVRSLTPKRSTAILKILNKYGLDVIKQVFQLTSESDFLLGNNNRDWNADFNWLMKEDNFIKVLEGNYNKRKKKQKLESRDGLTTYRTDKEQAKKFREELERNGEKVEY